MSSLVCPFFLLSHWNTLQFQSRHLQVTPSLPIIPLISFCGTTFSKQLYLKLDSWVTTVISHEIKYFMFSNLQKFLLLTLCPFATWFKLVSEERNLPVIFLLLIWKHCILLSQGKDCTVKVISLDVIIYWTRTKQSNQISGSGLDAQGQHGVFGQGLL